MVKISINLIEPTLNIYGSGIKLYHNQCTNLTEDYFDILFIPIKLNSFKIGAGFLWEKELEWFCFNRWVIIFYQERCVIHNLSAWDEITNQDFLFTYFLIMTLVVDYSLDGWNAFYLVSEKLF